MSLLWRVLATNAAVIVTAVLLLAATPGAVHVPRTLIDVVLLVVAVGGVLLLNLALLRPVFEPLQRLARTMRDVDVLPRGSAGARGQLRGGPSRLSI